MEIFLPKGSTISWLNFRRILWDLFALRGSILLIIVFWPIAFFTMILSQIQRFWRIGSSCSNTCHLVSDTDNSIMNLLLTKSGTELSKRIRDSNDQLTSLELVEACISQIRNVNPYINAITASRFEEARKRALSIDNAVRESTLCEDYHFVGIPILVKECMEIPGMPYTAGIVSRSGIIGDTMCIALSQAEKCGAIIIATTNVSEGCMWHESFNKVYGRTYNPYDFGRTCGGKIILYLSLLYDHSLYHLYYIIMFYIHYITVHSCKLLKSALTTQYNH